METSKPSLSCLPKYIIQQIIECNVISYVELCRLSCVSRIFHSLTKSNALWKNKFKQMWPDLATLFHADNTDWKFEFRQRLDCKAIISAALKKQSSYIYSGAFFEPGYILIREMSLCHPFGWNIIKDELLSIINDPDKFHNLNLKYCAKEVFWELRHEYLRRYWRCFLSKRPPNNSILIQGALLISRWLRPIPIDCTNGVTAQIRSLSEKVFQEVKKKSPNHPLIKRGMVADDKEMESSCWSPDECRTILRCINAVMFEELEFYGYNMFQCADDILIDKVLTRCTGISEMIAIVYEMLAGRLGVMCLPEGITGTFYLKWHERPHLDEIEAYAFIDVNHKGDFKSWDEICKTYKGRRCQWYTASEPVQILSQVCLHLIYAIPAFMDEDSILFMRSALNLFALFNANNKQLPLQARTRIQLACIEGNPTLHFRRSADKEVKYAVGMIMRHKGGEYRCVIYAWQRHRKNIVQDPNLQRNRFALIGVTYFVLVERGLKLLVNEEELEIDGTNEPVCNDEIGKYFESFNGCFYIPNHFKEEEYPEDARVRERFFRK